MGKSNTTEVQQTDQAYTQNQTQNTAQNQQQTQAQQQATTNLQTFLRNFLTNTTQNTTADSTQDTTQNINQNQTQNSTQQQNQNTTQQQNQTATAALPSFQQPVVDAYFKDLLSKYTTGGLTPGVYDGPRVAGATPAELAARTMATNYAGGQGSGFADSVMGASRTLLDPNTILNPANIPGMQATKDAMIRSVTRNLTEQILPHIRNSSSFAGGYGDNRQGIAEGLAIGRTNEGLAGALGNLDLGTYQAGLGAMQNALSMAPSTYNVGTAPANTMSQVGTAERADVQAGIDAQRAQFAEQQAASPGNVLNILRGLMGGQGDYGGQTAATGAGTTASTGTQAGQVAGTTTGTNTGTTTGTQTGTATGQTSGSESSTQFAQQLASMLGISLSDMQSLQTGQTEGTQTGTTTTNRSSKPSTLQQLGALASLIMIPFTFGASAAGIPASLGSGG